MLIVIVYYKVVVIHSQLALISGREIDTVYLCMEPSPKIFKMLPIV